MVNHQLRQPKERRYFRFKGFPLCNVTDTEAAVEELVSYFFGFTNHEGFTIFFLHIPGF